MKKITLLLLTLSSLIAISAFTVLNPGGISYHTGSPYDKMDCSMCHSGGSATPTGTITATPAFGAGNTYTAGTTYTLSVVCGGYPKFGFGLEILNSNTTTAADAGTFGAVVTSNCKKMVTGTKPTNIVQSAPTGTSNAATFSFRWTAPSTGTAYVYYCVNGVNGTGSTSGDKSKTFSMTLTPSVPNSTPTIVENTFNAALFPNPTHDFVTLNYSLKESSDVKAEIFTMEGKKSASFNYNNQIAGEHRETINLSELNLTNGIYSVSITAGNNRVTKNIVIQ